MMKKSRQFVQAMAQGKCNVHWHSSGVHSEWECKAIPNERDIMMRNKRNSNKTKKRLALMCTCINARM